MTDPAHQRDREPAAEPTSLATDSAAESTVGTGSVFAIGCSIATVLAILVGVAVFLLLRVL